MQKILSLLLLVSAPAFAGGGVTGGATEITQLANNAELVASVAQQAGIQATQLQQYITQLQQYQAQVQNLQGAAANVQQFGAMAKAGAGMGGVQGYAAMAQDLLNLKAAANNVTQNISVDAATMTRLGMTPNQYYGYVAQQAAAGNKVYSDQLKTTQANLADLQNKSQAVTALAQQIPNISGNVQGFQTLASQNAQMSAMLIDENGALNQLVAQSKAQAQGQAQNTEDKAAAMQAYLKAKAAEQQTTQQELSYPGAAQ